MGAGSVVTNQTGFLADSTLTSATNNYGFRGIIAAASGRYNLYMSGPADNYLAGKLILGLSQGVVQNGADGYLGISGGSSAALGGVIFAFGESHATNPNEIQFRNSTNTTRMTILSGGNVGIGNTAPTNTLSVTGTAYVSGNISAANVTVTSYHLRSVATGITAAGSTQGTATAITKELNVVSAVASSTGVVLPTAVAGMVITITNTSANSLLVYPATGAAINSLAANVSFTQVSNATLQFIAPTTTQWYTVGATYA
jgi:hypothetical protein